MFKIQYSGVYLHIQLLVSIPRLSAPSCHLVGKINALGTFFSTRQLCLQSKWPTSMKITDVSYRRMFPWHLLCPVDCGMVLRVQGQRPLAVYAFWYQTPFNGGLWLQLLFTSHSYRHLEWIFLAEMAGQQLRLKGRETKLA